MADFKEYGQSGVAGTVEFGKNGPALDVNGTAFEAFTADDLVTRAVIRAADPVASHDVVTLGYLMSRQSPVVIGNIYDSLVDAPASAQFTGAGQEGFIAICNAATLTGFDLNSLYRLDTWDTDVATSTWTEIVPSEGMTINVTDASSGGTIDYDADHIYMWNADGTPSWIDIGPASSEVYVEKNVLDTAEYSDGVGSHDMPVSIPVGGRIHGWKVAMVVGFNGTAPTMELGYSGDTDAFATTAEIDIESGNGIFQGNCYHEVTGSVLTPQYTLGGTLNDSGEAAIFIYWSKGL